NGLRMSLTILGNEFIIIINYSILILRPEFTIFWAIFITSFLTFNTCALFHRQFRVVSRKGKEPKITENQESIKWKSNYRSHR
ncbi:hypothetical protein, partial [Umezakia ovalisporum]|uniref:hypothetical protein n=1 Tax=Umezakia ovalisporum TaxID=75695 RepID=UPI0035B71621